MAEGFAVLSGVTGEARWLTLAGEVLETVLDSFSDGGGGFYDTAAGAERLIYRPSDPADNATPSGTFAAAGALLSYAALTGSAGHREAALAALRVLPALAGRYPRAAGWGLAVAEAVLAGPAEIAVVGPPGRQPTRDLHRTAMLAAPPGAVLALGDGTDATVPLLACWAARRRGRRLRLPQLHLPAARYRPGRAPLHARPVLTPLSRWCISESDSADCYRKKMTGFGHLAGSHRAYIGTDNLLTLRTSAR